MKTLLLVLSTLTVSIPFAQTDSTRIYLGSVFSDTTTLLKNDYRSPFELIANSEAPIEIRFTKAGFRSPIFYYQLKFQNKQWTLQVIIKNEQKKTSQTILFNDSLDVRSFFDGLVEKKIFFLPSQKDLQLDKSYYDTERDEIVGEGMDTADGIGYTVEFKVGDRFRRYSFWNPDSFKDFYKQYDEFTCYDGIAKQLDELLK